MRKRSYSRVQDLEGEIPAMREAGATRQEIANRFGLSKTQNKNWISRDNRKQAKLAAGIPSRAKGRPRKGARFVSKLRLRMKNELQRNFLQFTGSK